MNGNETTRDPVSGPNSYQTQTMPIPIPTELPPIPNFSQLPAHILHSGTVETLIGQNEDLFARLKVNIRRNSILEQQIMENERVNSEITRVNNSLISQLQVFQEKDRVWREKTFSVDFRHGALKDEVTLYRVQLKASEDRCEELEAGLALEASYRRRVRSWVRPLVDALKSSLIKARMRNRELENELSSRDAIVSDLKSRLSEAVSQMQSQERSNSRDQTKLVEKYELRTTELERELQKTRSEASLLRDKALRLDDAIASRTELENRIVFLERRSEESEKSFAEQALEAQEQVTKYRQEAKVLALEMLDYDGKLQSVSDELGTLQEDHLRLQDQFESLQALWSDSQRKLETSKLQHESLNRLNQELSRQLKEQRKALENSAAVKAFQETSSPKDLPTSSARSPQVISGGKIRSLLGEIEPLPLIPRASEAAPVKFDNTNQKPDDSDSSIQS